MAMMRDPISRTRQIDTDAVSRHHAKNILSRYLPENEIAEPKIVAYIDDMSS